MIKIANSSLRHCRCHHHHHHHYDYRRWFTITKRREFRVSLTMPSSSSLSSASSCDYVIVGAGSAGSVLARRLCEAQQQPQPQQDQTNATTKDSKNKNRVHILEAGQSDTNWWDPRNIFVHMPSALAWPMSMKKFNWAFQPEPEPILNGRVVSCPRGKGLGGSSAINGMVYVRGHPQDFNHWQELGASNWSFEHVLPYFQKAETWQHYFHSIQDENNENDKINKVYRGGSGPLHVRNGANASNTPLYEAFIEAGNQAGYGKTSDYNAIRQEGFAPMPMTVFHSGPLRGLRCSTSLAYLCPAKRDYPDQLTIETGAMVKRILFEEKGSNNNNKPPKAIGVEYVNKDGTLSRVLAEKEVILSAGAIQSPQLLQVSGIGAKDHLDSIGVPVLVENENVGQHLQDHMELYFQHEVIPPVSLADTVTSYFRQALVFLQWAFTREGLGASNHFEAAAFVRSSADKTYPDIQFHFIPIGISYDGKTVAKSRSGHSLQIHVGTQRSKSRGHVQARSNDALTPPEIRFNYLSHPDDWKDFRKGIEIARQVLRQPAMKDFVGEEIVPGAGADLDAFIRDHAESSYHPCGTCRMGDDPQKHQAVVDSQGRVHGVDSLRVVDASIFPSIPNGNLNAPTIMVAEKIAAHITGNLLEPVQFTKETAPWTIPDPTTDREGSPIVP